MSKLKLIAGPCLIDSQENLEIIAKELKRIQDDFDIDIVLKGSFEKANRTSPYSVSNIMTVDKAVELLTETAREYGFESTTDIHTEADIDLIMKYDVDIIQIPAFLSRQTMLIRSAAQTGKDINIKKGQFMSPWSTEFAAMKVSSAVADKENMQKIYLTERGMTFGYNDLISDIRSIPIMNKFGIAVMDCTHSNQRPNMNGKSGGNDEMKVEFTETLAKSAVAAGANVLFIEVHPNPSKSPSDSETILHLDKLYDIIAKCVKIKNALEDI